MRESERVVVRDGRRNVPANCRRDQERRRERKMAVRVAVRLDAGHRRRECAVLKNSHQSPTNNDRLCSHEEIKKKHLFAM